MKRIRDFMIMYQPPLVFCVCGAILLSLSFSLVVYPRIEYSFHAQQDADRYGEIGRNFYEGNGFRFTDAEMSTVSRGPIYPLMIAALCWVFRGYSVLSIQVLQAFILGGSVLFVFFVTRQLSTLAVARWAAFFIAFNPIFMWYSARIWTETLLTIMILFVAYRLVRFFNIPTFWRALFLGMVVGITSLIRSGVILFIPFLIIICLSRFKWKEAKYLFVSFLCVIIIILPWSVRNYRVTKEFIPVQTTAASNFIVGKAIAQDFTKYPLSFSQSMERATSEIGDTLDNADISPLDAEEAVGEAYLRNMIIREVWNNPKILFQKISAQVFTFWYLAESPLKSILILIVQLPIILSAIAGIIFMGRRKQKLFPLLSIIVYWWGIAVCFIAHARIAVPIVPLVIILAVIGLLREIKYDQTSSA